jgi:hypothetical protein
LEKRRLFLPLKKYTSARPKSPDPCWCQTRRQCLSYRKSAGPGSPARRPYAKAGEFRPILRRHRQREAGAQHFMAVGNVQGGRDGPASGTPARRAALDDLNGKIVQSLKVVLAVFRKTPKWEKCPVER